MVITSTMATWRGVTCSWHGNLTHLWGGWSIDQVYGCGGVRSPLLDGKVPIMATCLAAQQLQEL